MRISHAVRLVLVDPAQEQQDDYVAPYSLPWECDHDTFARCWLCCPCDDCGGVRHRHEAGESSAEPVRPPVRPSLTLVQ